MRPMAANAAADGPAANRPIAKKNKIIAGVWRRRRQTPKSPPDLPTKALLLLANQGETFPPRRKQSLRRGGNMP